MHARIRHTHRDGLSMVEALVAVTITTVAGGALLASIGSTVRSSTQLAHTAIAHGLADQLMHEIAATRFPAATNPAPTGDTRESFDDCDDYHQWSASPPEDRQGRALGTEGLSVGGGQVPRLAGMQPDTDFLSRWTREVEVERLEPDGGTGWTVVSQHTNFRRVIVRVKYTNADSNQVTLAEIARVFAYVPFTP